MKENWKQENLEKTKKVLKDHFKRKKEEEMFKKMLRETLLFSALPLPHFGTDWNIDDSEFDEFEDLTDSNDNNKVSE